MLREGRGSAAWVERVWRGRGRSEMPTRHSPGAVALAGRLSPAVRLAGTGPRRPVHGGGDALAPGVRVEKPDSLLRQFAPVARHPAFGTHQREGGGRHDEGGGSGNAGGQLGVAEGCAAEQEFRQLGLCLAIPGSAVAALHATAPGAHARAAQGACAPAGTATGFSALARACTLRRAAARAGRAASSWVEQRAAMELSESAGVAGLDREGRFPRAAGGTA